MSVVSCAHRFVWAGLEKGVFSLTRLLSFGKSERGWKGMPIVHFGPSSFLLSPGVFSSPLGGGDGCVRILTASLL